MAWKNSALLESGTEMVPQKVLFYGRSNGAPSKGTILVPLVFLSVDLENVICSTKGMTVLVGDFGRGQRS